MRCFQLNNAFLECAVDHSPLPAAACSEGVRVGWSDEVLGFDCGGQQWVLEVAFPAGTVDKPDGRCVLAAATVVQTHPVPPGCPPACKPASQRLRCPSACTCSPAYARPPCSDLAYMQDLLQLVQRHGVPAPAPIEQRWTAGSAAPMSPAAGDPRSLHSWVGVIMYLPEEAGQRAAVTEG